ncbi:MAG: hypothetical protein KDC38_06025 [Planctomycetes bacterium]|nr:hypothetical protein [Planctomycetota bacterium]
MIRSWTFLALIATPLAFLFGESVRAQAEVPFIRGDVNRDGVITLTDLSVLATHLFGAAAAPACLDALDFNDDGAVDIADFAGAIAVVVEGGASLPAPFPDEGADPTADALLCLEGPAGSVLGSDIDHVFFSFQVEGGTGPGVAPGQDPVVIPIVLDSTVPVRGFSLAVWYDAATLQSLDLDLEAGVAGELGAEFCVTSSPELPPESGSSVRTGHVLLEALPPFTSTVVPASTGLILGSAVFRVAPDVVPGSSVLLTLGSNPTLSTPGTTLITQEYQALVPLVETVAIPVYPSAGLFVRGDVNGDAAVDLADVIELMGAVLVGGEAGDCLDAMDVDDTGNIDLADPVRLLELLFAGDPSLPVPFPHLGFDATPDALPDCGSPTP